ncbi:MAG: hypothetical protein CL468_08055 [Acidimicrobiaceae bacterium]|nr:hypothetical protein [Acidimicrobiaceae bacterium]
MERPEIDWDDTDAFTAGTTGPQGRRVFFLQARRAGQVVSLKLEKQQVAGLAEFLHGLMGDLPPIDEPAVEVAETSARFEDPEEADWVIGSLGVTYQQSTDRLVLIAEELLRDEDLVPAQARFPMRRELVAAFIVRARELVAAGRPPCPWCGAPLDPAVDGWCPCVN